MVEKYKKIAVVFPGQGSQAVGMLGELGDKYPVVKETFATASEVLGYDLWELIQQGPTEKLNQTEFTQPALLTADIAAWRCAALQPSLLAGHSLGEYSALVAAEALGFADAVSLVAARGRLMQEAVPEGIGAMAAIIGLTDTKILELCDDAAQGEILTPANYNSVGQTVVAGELAAVNRAVNMAKEYGAKLAKLLPVSVPSHCKLMKKASENLAVLLADIVIETPSIPVVNNAAVECYNYPESIREGLVQQLYNPVRWVETIQYFATVRVDCIVECGPGKVLAGLNKRITKEIPTINFVELVEKR